MGECVGYPVAPLDQILTQDEKSRWLEADVPWGNLDDEGVTVTEPDDDDEMMKAPMTEISSCPRSLPPNSFPSVPDGSHILLCWPALFPGFGGSHWHHCVENTRRPGGVPEAQGAPRRRQSRAREDKLAPKLHDLLDEMKVEWTSTDVVRIGYVEEPSTAPVIVWIGVKPKSLSGNDGADVASGCKSLLEEHDIPDVDVEIRESVVTRCAGPKLLPYTYSSDGTVDIRQPLTTTLGLPISTQAWPHIEGTAGFFIAEDSDTKRLLLVTARHVVLATDGNDNELFERKDESQPPHNVTIFGEVGFNKYLESIQKEIGDRKFNAEYEKGRLRVVEGKDGAAVEKERQKAQTALDEANDEMEPLRAFYEEVSTHWATPESRILGHVILSLPFNTNVGSQGYTEDWAVIEVDRSKIDSSNFQGNVIDLGTRIPAKELTRMMECNDHSFNYPRDRLLRLRGTITDYEMRMCKEAGLMVMKNGRTTGLTVGRANNIYSHIRNYFDDGTTETSKEWPILPFDSESGVFSKGVTPGLSSSTVSDALAASSPAVLPVATRLPRTSHTPRPSASSSRGCKPKGCKIPSSTHSTTLDNVTLYFLLAWKLPSWLLLSLLSLPLSYFIT